ncbi:MAG TPA: hypothetical protein VFL80_13000 [Thermoanaerobaculia bacterium]|nr:hypothetical protein [Thermoanaerobaculia bacterium]
MDDIERDDDAGEDEYDDQLEQMIIENGILLHSVAALLVRKGILQQEELETEMDKLYDEMENFGE